MHRANFCILYCVLQMQKLLYVSCAIQKLVVMINQNRISIEESKVLIRPLFFIGGIFNYCPHSIEKMLFLFLKRTPKYCRNYSLVHNSLSVLF